MNRAAQKIQTSSTYGVQVESLKKLIVQLRVMVHDLPRYTGASLYDLGEVDHAIAALGIDIPDLKGVKCERLQRLAALLKLPHDPDGYTLAGIERAVEERVNWP